MGISINLRNISSHQNKIAVDRETVGVLIPSDSGYDFPQIIDNYEDLVTIFSDGKTPLSHYKLILDAGYSIAPMRVSQVEDNYASLTVTTDKDFTHYCTPSEVPYELSSTYPHHYDSNGKFHFSQRGDDKYPFSKVDDDPEMTNHIVVQFPKTVSRSDVGFLTLPAKINDVTIGKYHWTLQLLTFGPPSSDSLLQSMYNLRLENYKLSVVRNRLPITNNTVRFNSMVSGDFFNFLDVPYRCKILDAESRTVLIYSPTLFPKITASSPHFKVYTSEYYTHKVREMFGQNNQILTFKSLIPGTYGKRIAIRFQYRNKRGSVTVYFNGKVVETYQWEGDVWQMMYEVNTTSKFIRTVSPRDVNGYTELNKILEVNPDIDIISSLGGLKDESERTESDYLRALDSIAHEDCRIDLFLYDGPVTPSIMEKISHLSDDNEHLLTICNVTEVVKYELDNVIFTYGHCISNGKLIPSSHYYLRLLKDSWVGEVRDVRLHPPLTSDLKRNLISHQINFIDFDGLKYYVNYYTADTKSPRHIIQQMTRCRIHRRFHRVVELLGTTLDDLRDFVTTLISQMREDIDILESIELKRLVKKDSIAIVEIEYKFPQLRSESLTLDITLNILN